MNWFPIALTCAFLTSCADALSKRLMAQNDQWTTGAVVLTIAGIVLIPVFMTQEIRPVSWHLIGVLAVALPFEILGYYLFLSAIRMGPLSLTVPLLAFTPVITILTSAVIVGERVSASGAVGISLVTIGAYLLNADLAGRALLAPITAIFTQPGSRTMFLVAVIWSISSAIGKKGVLLYGAIPFGFVLVWTIIPVFVGVSLVRARLGYGRAEFSGRSAALFLLAGCFMAGSELTHFVSISMAPVAYMISVKRLSMVFGVILGWLFFGERNIRYRLVGASTMVCGVFFLG